MDIKAWVQKLHYPTCITYASMGVIVLIIYIICACDCTDDQILSGECWGWFYYIHKACDAGSVLCDNNSFPVLIGFGVAIGVTYCVAAWMCYYSRTNKDWVLYALIATGVSYALFIIGFSIVMSQINSTKSTAGDSLPDKMLRSSNLFMAFSIISWLISSPAVAVIYGAWHYGLDEKVPSPTDTSNIPMATVPDKQVLRGPQGALAPAPSLGPKQ